MASVDDRGETSEDAPSFIGHARTTLRKVIGPTRGPASPLSHLAAYLRFNQCSWLLRRAAGWPAWRADDFLRDLAPACGQRLAEIACAVRGAHHPPAIFIHGVLPRSGTNFLANLLALHPEVAAFPRGLWEFPLLHVAPGAQALQSEFLAMFPRSSEVLQPYELLAYLAGGWLAGLQHEAGERRVLLKSPHAQNLFLFPHLFPRDKLVLCLRDGRDVVASTSATFRSRLLRKSFRQLVSEWKLAADAVLSFAPGGANAHPNVIVARYEDLAGGAPGAALQGLLDRLDLDAACYPFAAASELPVFGSSASAEAGDARWRPRPRTAGFSPIGRWQGWPRRRKQAFLRLAGDTLARAGYSATVEGRG
jgi:protein-tyrosine sulfotransferase